MSFYRGKTCFITGASRGLGAGMARRLAKEGAKLILFARSRPEIEDLARELSASGAETIALTGDVTRAEDLTRAADEAVARFGGLDVVIANAGIGSQGYFSSFSLDDFRRVMDVNFYGVLYTIHATLPHLRQRPDSRLGIVSSVAGKVSLPTSTAYSASKFALHGLGESLRAEEAQRGGPKVTLLCPGFFASDIRQHAIHRGLKREDPPALFTMPTDEAARQSLRAVAQGVAEAAITGHAKVILALRRFAPRVITETIMIQATKRLTEEQP
jgi:short-subunit dehydrogenase